MLKKMVVIGSLALGGFAIHSTPVLAAPSSLPHAAAAVEALGSPTQYAQYYYGPPRRRYVPRRYVHRGVTTAAATMRHRGAIMEDDTIGRPSYALRHGDIIATDYKLGRLRAPFLRKSRLGVYQAALSLKWCRLRT